MAELNFPDSLKCIKEGAFSCNRVVREIVMPLGLTEIEGMSFLFCNDLTSVFLPSSLKKIGKYAFTWIRALQTSSSYAEGASLSCPHHYHAPIWKIVCHIPKRHDMRERYSTDYRLYLFFLSVLLKVPLCLGQVNCA